MEALLFIIWVFIKLLLCIVALIGLGWLIKELSKNGYGCLAIIGIAILALIFITIIGYTALYILFLPFILLL